MSSNYLTIEPITDGYESLVSEDLKFRTGKFVWRIKFNVALDPKSVNNSSVFVLNENQTPLNTNISYNSTNNFIEIEPLEPYSESQPYILYITTKVRSKGGKYLKKEISLQFQL